MEEIIRVALCNENGRWIQGTILSTRPLGDAEHVNPKRRLGIGDIAGQLILRVKTKKYKSARELGLLRMRKIVNLRGFMSDLSLEVRREQKQNWTDLRSGKTVIYNVNLLAVMPKLDDKYVVDLDLPGVLFDVPFELLPTPDDKDL
jgi:hypothetical protein